HFVAADAGIDGLNAQVLLLLIKGLLDESDVALSAAAPLRDGVTQEDDLVAFLQRHFRSVCPSNLKWQCSQDGEDHSGNEKSRHGWLLEVEAGGIGRVLTHSSILMLSDRGDQHHQRFLRKHSCLPKVGQTRMLRTTLTRIAPAWRIQ